MWKSTSLVDSGEVDQLEKIMEFQSFCCQLGCLENHFSWELFDCFTLFKHPKQFLDVSRPRSEHGWKGTKLCESYCWLEKTDSLTLWIQWLLQLQFQMQGFSSVCFTKLSTLRPLFSVYERHSDGTRRWAASKRLRKNWSMEVSVRKFFIRECWHVKRHESSLAPGFCLTACLKDSTKSRFLLSFWFYLLVHWNILEQEFFEKKLVIDKVHLVQVSTQASSGWNDLWKSVNQRERRCDQSLLISSCWQGVKPQAHAVQQHR